MSLVEDRRKEWKKRFMDKLENSKSPESAITLIMAEFIYYSKDAKELRRRSKMILQEFSHISNNILATRKNEFDEKELGDISVSLRNIVNKLLNK